MRDSPEAVVYWDASAVLSALFRDPHSEEAQAWSRKPGVHLLPSLAWAEAHAVICRISRERVANNALLVTTREALNAGPWRLLNVTPDWEITKAMAAKWPLRGADLWHLSAAKTLVDDLPGLVLLTFDDRLRTAATGEGLAAGPSDGGAQPGN